MPTKGKKYEEGDSFSAAADSLGHLALMQRLKKDPDVLLPEFFVLHDNSDLRRPPEEWPQPPRTVAERERARERRAEFNKRARERFPGNAFKEHDLRLLQAPRQVVCSPR